MGTSKSQLYANRMAFIGRRMEQNKVGHDQQTGWIEEKKIFLTGIISQVSDEMLRVAINQHQEDLNRSVEIISW